MPLFQQATATQPPQTLIIAEIGVNHDGQLERAQTLIHAAHQAGADAVKFQYFHPDRLLSSQALLAGYQKDKVDSPQQLLEALVLSIDELAILNQLAHELGLLFIVTPFSLEDVDDLAGLDLDAIKIASPDAVNLPLLKAAARLSKPMLISTGTCELNELEDAASLLQQHPQGGVLLHCVSCYPTPIDQAQLLGMHALQETFGLPVGYSDHTPALHTGALAVAAGAVVIEKHLTHDPAAPGPDHAASLGPSDFQSYVQHIREAQAMLGQAGKKLAEHEKDVFKVSRQSLCAKRDIQKGDTLDADNLTLKRPGTGIPARYFEQALGKAALRDISADELLDFGDIQGL